MSDNDLFPEAVQDSPYVAFVKRHGISTHFKADCPKPWSAFLGTLSAMIERDEDPEMHGYGTSEKAAVEDLATKNQLDGWEGVNW
jgi:hypothetical protein